MEFEEAFGITDTAVFDKKAIHLNDVQKAILLGTWEGQTYRKIAENHLYSHEYLQNDVGNKLWEGLSEVFGEKVKKKNFKTVLTRQAQKIGSLQLQDREAAEETILNKSTDPNPLESALIPKSSIELISFLEYFSKAIDKLKSEDIDVRLSAIATLRILAKCSQPTEYWTILESLAAFIRAKASRKKEEEDQRLSRTLPKDIQAALSVIVQRDLNKNEGVIDLSNTDLRGVKFSKPNLHRVNLGRANLKGVRLIGAIMCRASLRGANLQNAFLWKAELQWAKLFFADLQGANLSDANLESADLRNTKLHGANFSRVNLHKTYLRGVDLTGVKNLNLRQIVSADGDSMTRLPENLSPPLRWMQAKPLTAKARLIKAALELRNC